MTSTYLGRSQAPSPDIYSRKEETGCAGLPVGGEGTLSKTALQELQHAERCDISHTSSGADLGEKIVTYIWVSLCLGDGCGTGRRSCPWSFGWPWSAWLRGNGRQGLSEGYS